MTMRVIICLFLILTGSSTLSLAGTSGASGMFNQGDMSMSILLGNDMAFDRSYTVLGLGYGYYILDGLQAGFDAEVWSGGARGIERVSPQLRYVWNAAGAAKPYAGLFYSRTFIERYRDNDTAGLRGGAFFVTGGRAYVGAGLVYDNHLNCDRNVYSSCVDVYPEVFVLVVF